MERRKRYIKKGEKNEACLSSCIRRLAREAGEREFEVVTRETKGREE